MAKSMQGLGLDKQEFYNNNPFKNKNAVKK